MKKLLLFFLLFSPLLLVAEEISLNYLGESSIFYAKPYIYIFDKEKYKKIKIPEMTVSEPSYFKLSDSTFTKNFLPSSYTLQKVNNKHYLTQNLGGVVFEMRGNELIRIDHSYEHKMQINAQSFVYDNRIFRFGGYGFWSARNFFTYFDINSREWESYSPVHGDKIPPGLFDVNQYLDGDEVSYFNGITINKYDNLKFEKTQDIWRFNLKTKIWEYRGKTAVFFGNNPHNFQYDHYYIAFTEERRIIRVNFKDDTYEVFENEAVSSKMSPQFKPFVENGIVYYFANNHASMDIDLMSLPIDKFLGRSIRKEPFIERNIFETYGNYLITILVLFISSLGFYFVTKFRTTKARIITDKEGVLYAGKAAINFDETELRVIKYLLKNDDVPNSELLSLVEQKGVHFSHTIRVKNDVLNQLNLKLKAILQVDVNFIIFKKSETDSRLKVYRLNKQYFKLSKEFLQD